MSGSTEEAPYRERLAQLGCVDPMRIEWPPGHVRARHSHAFHACGIVIRGAFTLTTSEGPRLLQAGDLFQLAAGIPHEEQVCPEGASLLVGAMSPRS
jgi:quercetin dioxygenase-like cupin family protein